MNEKNTRINVLNQDIDRLENSNQESLNNIDILIDEINRLKNNENNLNTNKKN